MPAKRHPHCRLAADFAVVDLNKLQAVTGAVLRSAQVSTPFEGVELTGWLTLTLLRGQVVFSDGKIVGKPGMGEYIKPPVALHMD